MIQKCLIRREMAKKISSENGGFRRKQFPLRWRTRVDIIFLLTNSICWWSNVIFAKYVFNVKEMKIHVELLNSYSIVMVNLNVLYRFRYHESHINYISQKKELSRYTKRWWKWSNFHLHWKYLWQMSHLEGPLKKLFKTRFSECNFMW